MLNDFPEATSLLILCGRSEEVNSARGMENTAKARPTLSEYKSATVEIKYETKTTKPIDKSENKAAPKYSPKMLV